VLDRRRRPPGAFYTDRSSAVITGLMSMIGVPFTTELDGLQ
jgi:hypothetical protein